MKDNNNVKLKTIILVAEMKGKSRGKEGNMSMIEGLENLN
jgi:hypothetical protein